MLNLRWFQVWRRNYHVWIEFFFSSLIGNFADPLIYLLALGYGFGSLIGSMDGMPYLVFLASGIVCSSAMNAASFESTFSAYTRMAFQKTWEGMLSTPLGLSDIVLGETIWAGTKGLINACAILIVATFLGLVANWQALWVLPVIFLLSCCFAAIGLVVTSLAKSYDFFTYYLTLLLTPMMLLSGVFFPLHQMPLLIQRLAQLLPLYHAVVLVRPLMTAGVLTNSLLHLGVIFVYTLFAYAIALISIKRRMIQ